MAKARALVTGASSGIGRAVVEALAAAGWQVHALARRSDRLAALAAATGAVPHAADATDRAALAAAVAAADPDLVVANAGGGAGIAGLARAAAEDVSATVRLNVEAPLELLRLALPAMIARRHGHVVLMGSVAGLYPGPSAIYGATKAAVRMMGWNLRQELRGTGVRVSEILPGRVTTEFYDAAVPDPATRSRLKTTGIRELTPADVAAAVLWAVSAPAHVNVSAIELQPLEQSFGGISFNPVGDALP